MSIIIEPIRGMQSFVHDDLVHLLIKHAALSPTQVAVLTTDTALTYQQLYLEVVRWKSFLSQHVQNRAVVCIERTPRMMAVLLALLWLDVAYVPIEPGIPSERLRHVLKDSEAQVLLYDDASPALKQETWSCLALNLDQIKCPDFHLCSQTPPIGLSSRQLAYIIYTSGSTGKPKGVAIAKQALNNFLASMSQYFLNEAHALLLATTTITFDIAILELFLPIWQGRTVLLASSTEHKHPLHLKSLLDRYPVTLFQSTPSLWNMLYAVGWEGKPGMIALTGGEPLSPTLAEKLLSDVAQVWNMYGPTEATVWCSLKQIIPGEPITVGRPIDNMEMRVLNDAQQILPPGCKGELYISGLGLAEGYINREQLNQERFLACDDALSGRLYRVGDIACTTESGEFIIWGRSDNQIKLHGYRIEPEEIEAEIKKISGVYDCAVAVKHEQLIAYIALSSPKETVSQEILRKHLNQYLPDYMIPSRVIYLDTLPLSQNGKIQRHALPEPNALSAVSYVLDSESVTDTESCIMTIWQQELACTAMSRHDNFFELGGHSLVAARVIAKVAAILGKQVTLRDFYRFPSVAQFAAYLDMQTANIQDKTSRFHLPESKHGFPLADFQWMLWLSRLFERRLKVFNVVARRRVLSTLNKAMLDKALQTVVQNNDVLQYRIHRFYPRQMCHHLSIVPTWIETSLHAATVSQYEGVLASSVDTLFYEKNWQHGPMFEARVFYLPDNQTEMHIAMSHLIADEQSLSIFFDALSAAYDDGLDKNDKQDISRNSQGMAPILSNYRAYVSQERAMMVTRMKDDVSFWKTYLQDATLFPFPKQHIVADINTQGASFSTCVDIPESIMMRLQQFCACHQVTINDALLAAVGLSLRACCDTSCTRPIYMNTVKSTRDNPLYDHLIGCYLRMHAIKLDLRQESSLAVMAKQAQLASLDTSEYQYAPGLVKMAALPHTNFIHNAWLRAGISWLFALFSAATSRIHILKEVVQACASIASWDRRAHHLININVLNSFLSHTDSSRTHLCGAALQAVPPHSPHVIPMPSVFDVWFFKESGRARILVASNLTTEFREQFAKTLLTLLKQAPVVRETRHHEAQDQVEMA